MQKFGLKSLKELWQRTTASISGVTEINFYIFVNGRLLCETEGCQKVTQQMKQSPPDACGGGVCLLPNKGKGKKTEFNIYMRTDPVLSTQSIQ